MREGQLSLELNRPRPLGGDTYQRGEWERLPYDGAPDGIGPHEVPPAFAMGVPKDNSEQTSVAYGVLTALASKRVLVSMKGREATETRSPRKPK